MSFNGFLNHDGLSYLWSKVVNRISSSETNITAKIPVASDDLPKDLGLSSPGVSSKFSRSDHVHKIPDDIVSYTDAQTDVEETTKINADLLENHPASDFAPSGFGLGGAAKVLTQADNLNDVWEAGWYTWDSAPQNAPTIGGSLIPYCSMNVLNKGGNYNIHQIALTYEGYEIRRYYDGKPKTWSEWAWVNPPMDLGVEYRTTEQYFRKPVYCKVVDFGALPNATIKRFRHNIPGISAVIAVHGSAGDQVLSPGAFGGGLLTIAADNTEIQIKTSGDYSAYVAYVALKYTK